MVSAYWFCMEANRLALKQGERLCTKKILLPIFTYNIFEPFSSSRAMALGGSHGLWGN